MLTIARIQEFEHELDDDLRHFKAVLQTSEELEYVPFGIYAYYYKGWKAALSYVLRSYRRTFESELSIDL